MAAPIFITDFKGEIPRLHPRLLPRNHARRSLNTRLTNGTLSAFRGPKLVHDFGAPVQTAILHNGAWIGFPGPANVVRGPIASDRLYYTAGAATPKMRVGETEYELALPGPTTAPVLTALSAVNPAAVETVLYAYTFVTSFGEESPPSPASAPLQWSSGVTVRVSSFAAPVANRAVTKIRLYRSQTSLAGVTDFYFVAEFPVATTQHDHDVAAAPLQEVLPSSDYDPPPSGLTGLTAMQNGMIAGFSGRELFFAEPFIPHAWPRRYALTTDFPIVGLAAFGSTLAVLTTGTPYIAQGAAPEAMVMERMDANMPCIAPRGIVDLGYAAAYPSNDGLALITASSVQLASRTLFSRDDWRALNPAAFFAENYDGRYAFAYEDGRLTTVNAGTVAAPSANLFDGGLATNPSSAGFTVYDAGTPLTSGGLRSLGFIDLTGEQPYFIRTDSAVNEFPSALYLHEQTGVLHTITDDGRVYAFDAADQPVARYAWESPQITFETLGNFGAMLIESDTLNAAVGELEVSLYAEGALVHTVRQVNEPLRLPSGYLARNWRIEARGNVPITAISVALTPSQLAGGG